METIYFILETRIEITREYYADYEKIVIGIFQEEEQALQLLKNLNSLPKKARIDGKKYEITERSLQKICKGSVFATGGSDKWYLFPESLGAG